MEKYRTVWLSLVVAAATIGAWTTLTAWSLAGGLSTFVACSIIGACVATAMTGELRWQAAVAAGLLCGLAVLGILGLGLILEVLLIPLLLIMAVSSPTAVVWFRRFVYWHNTAVVPDESGAAPSESASGTDPSPAGVVVEPDEPEMDPAVEAMDDAALCLAWRMSYLALERPLPFASRLRWVERRQECLDELERRNPSGFSAWLASGARAAGDPSKYILRAERRDYPDRQV